MSADVGQRNNAELPEQQDGVCDPMITPPRSPHNGLETTPAGHIDRVNRIMRANNGGTAADDSEKGSAVRATSSQGMGENTLNRVDSLADINRGGISLDGALQHRVVSTAIGAAAASRSRSASPREDIGLQRDRAESKGSIEPFTPYEGKEPEAVDSNPVTPGMPIRDFEAGSNPPTPGMGFDLCDDPFQIPMPALSTAETERRELLLQLFQLAAREAAVVAATRLQARDRLQRAAQEAAALAATRQQARDCLQRAAQEAAAVAALREQAEQPALAAQQTAAAMPEHIQITDADSFIKKAAGLNSTDHEKRLLKEELDKRAHQFRELITWAEELELEEDKFQVRKGKKGENEKRTKKHLKREQIQKHWMLTLEVLLDESLPADFRLRLVQSIKIAPKNPLETACKNYKPLWGWINWLRLLMLRIKRLFIGIADVVAPQASAVKVADATWASAYDVLGHLGYLIYMVRFFSYTLPCLISAAKKEGWAGFKRVWDRESESIWNDGVWAGVGLITCFAGAFIGTAGCAILVVALYAFDIANIVLHAKKRKKKLEKQFQDAMHLAILICHNLATENIEINSHDQKETRVSDHENRLRQLIEGFNANTDYQAQIKAAPEELQHTMRKKLMREMLLARDPVLAANFSAVDHLATMARVQSELADSADQTKTKVIEASVLLGGMVVSCAGTLTFALCSSIGIAGSKSVAAVITALCAGMTTLTLSPAMAIGLALIAVGAAVVIAMCITRVVKQAREHKKKVAIRENDKTAPSGRVSIFTESRDSSAEDRSESRRESRRESSGSSFGASVVAMA